MVILKTTTPVYEDGVEHISTTWQVASDPDFNDILIESIEDENNLIFKILNIEITADVEYYARARFVYDIGMSEWSNVDAFISENVVENTVHVRTPTSIEAPMLKTALGSNHLEVYDVNEHPNTYFTVYMDSIVPTANNTHIATTWLVEDIYGNVIFFKDRDQDNLLELHITKLLPLNTVLSIKAQVHMASGDISEFGGVNIYTSNDEDFYIISDGINILKLQAGEIIKFNRPVGFIEAEFEIYDNDGLYTSFTTSDLNISIDTIIGTLYIPHMLRTRVNYGNRLGEWTYYVISMAVGGENLPSNLPYTLTN